MTAIFSPCGDYRYRLERDLRRDGPTVALIGVNPSKAGAEVNDQTIRKDIGFGARHGWGRIIKGNKFARVSTDVKGLRSVKDPVGPENDAHLEQIMRDADQVVVCWGRSRSCRPPCAGAGTRSRGSRMPSASLCCASASPATVTRAIR